MCIRDSYGTYVLQEFEIILRKKEYISSYVLQMKSTAREPLLVGMSFGVLSALPHNFLSDFITQHPYIELNYSDYTDITLENRLLKGEMCIRDSPCDLHRVTGILEVHKINTFYYSAPVHIQAGNNSLGKHNQRPSLCIFVKFSSILSPIVLLFSGWN